MRIEDETVPLDAELVESAIHGNADSFRVLFDRYYPMIYAFAYRVFLIETEAEDVAQETFIRAARGLASYRGEASFKNWLYRVAHNVLVDFQRKSVRRRAMEEELSSDLATNSQTRHPDFAEVRLALQKIAPDLREAVALVYFDEMSHRDAARILGCAETTVSWRIFRAKSALKKLLKSKTNE